MIVSKLLSQSLLSGWQWDGIRGEKDKASKRKAQSEKEKRKRWKDRQKEPYGKWVDGGLSQLCGLESLFVHKHFRITRICPHPLFLTQTLTLTSLLIHKGVTAANAIYTHFNSIVIGRYVHVSYHPNFFTFKNKTFSPSRSAFLKIITAKSHGNRRRNWSINNLSLAKQWKAHHNKHTGNKKTLIWLLKFLNTFDN